MNTYYIVLLTVFGVVAYMMTVDENVSTFLLLIPRIIKVNIERFYWRIRFHPIMTTNKLAQWWMMRKYEKMMEQLQNEQENQTHSSTPTD